MDSLIVTIRLNCESDAEGRELVITDDTFFLTCNDAVKKIPHRLEFTFREPIDAANSICVPTGATLVCTLGKQEPHYFDRLMRGDPLDYRHIRYNC